MPPLIDSAYADARIPPSTLSPKSRKDVQLIPSPHIDLRTISLDKRVDSCPNSHDSAMEAARGCLNSLEGWTVA